MLEEVLKKVLVKMLVEDLRNAPDLAMKMCSALEGTSAPTALRATMLLLVAQAQTGGFNMEQVLTALRTEWDVALEIEAEKKKEKGGV